MRSGRQVMTGCIAAGAVLLGGCGSLHPGSAHSGSAHSGSAHSGSAQPGSAASASASALTGCRAAGLRVTLDARAAGAAAGSMYIPIDFTNTSGTGCRLDGYPGVTFATRMSGGQIGAGADQDRTAAPRRVILAPGGTAHAWLRVTDAGNYPAAQCHPMTAAGLRILAPGQPGLSYVPHAFVACAAAMHGSALLSVQPVEPGRGRRGTAQ